MPMILNIYLQLILLSWAPVSFLLVPRRTPLECGKVSFPNYPLIFLPKLASLFLLVKTPFSSCLVQKSVSCMTPLPSQSIPNAENSLCSVLKMYSESDHFSSSIWLPSWFLPVYLDYWDYWGWFTGSYPSFPNTIYSHIAARVVLLKKC